MDQYTAMGAETQACAPYVGMPIEHRYMELLGIDDMPLAMAYVPFQAWNQVYDPATALAHGTIFPELVLPFLGGGMNHECR